MMTGRWRCAAGPRWPMWMLSSLVALCLAGCSSDASKDGKPIDKGNADVAQDAAADATVAPDIAEAPDIKVEPDIPPKPVVYTCADRAKCEHNFCDQVLIPAGEFLMGTTKAPDLKAFWPAGDARPPHEVQLHDYCIDKYEVSLERYEACVVAGVCTPMGLLWKADEIKTTVNHYPNSCLPDLNKCKNRAVNGKNYYQARDYCEWIGSRLCTEAEWERAAHGPGLDARKHPWGNAPMSKDLVNVQSTGTGFVEAVDSYAKGASPEGIHNLAGNVYEWTRDAYQPYDPPADGSPRLNPTNPPKSATVKVVGRGSCFFTEPKDTVTDRTLFDMTFDWG